MGCHVGNSPTNLVGSLVSRAGVVSMAEGTITCVAREMVMKRQASEGSDAGKPEVGRSPPS